MEYLKLVNCAKIKYCSAAPSRLDTRTVLSKWFVCANFLSDNTIMNKPVENYLIPDDDWLLQKHDIVIKRIEPTFVNYIDSDQGEVYCGNNLIIVSPYDKEDARYLAMVLNKKISGLSTESSIGAVMKSVSRSDLELLEIPMPVKRKRQALGNLWYCSVELKKKRTKLAALENKKIDYLINKSIYVSGGKDNG